MTLFLALLLALAASMLLGYRLVWGLIAASRVPAGLGPSG